MVTLILYASRTGTKRNLAEMRRFGWRVLISAAGVWRSEGFPYAIDNGAWTSHQRMEPFDHGRYQTLLSMMGVGADWIVIPDVVGDAHATAIMTDRWVPKVASLRALAVIQDGADARDLDRLLGHVHGFFLGGSTEYKLANLDSWARYALERNLYFHVGRVNSARRIQKCKAAGAHSIDGTSASRFSANTAGLTRAAIAPAQLSIRWAK